MAVLHFPPCLSLQFTRTFHCVCLSQTHCVKLVKVTSDLRHSAAVWRKLLSHRKIRYIGFSPGVTSDPLLFLSVCLSVSFCHFLFLQAHSQVPLSCSSPPALHTWLLDQCQPQCSRASPFACTSPPRKQSCLSLHSDAHAPCRHKNMSSVCTNTMNCTLAHRSSRRKKKIFSRQLKLDGTKMFIRSVV